MRLRPIVLIATLCLAAALPAAAQDTPPAAPSRPNAQTARVPLKVTVVLSRYQGDKRLSSMPYVLGVMSSARSWGPPHKTTLRMGTNVPITHTVVQGPTVDGKPGSPATTSYSYRDVGTNIDCAVSFDDSARGLFQVLLTVEDTSVGLDTPKRSGLAPDVPTFRSFNSSFTALLTEGQTMQYMTATDPVTGEVMKIDVTLAVMK
jgi:hypothetical protein